MLVNIVHLSKGLGVWFRVLDVGRCVWCLVMKVGCLVLGVVCLVLGVGLGDLVQISPRLGIGCRVLSV